MGSRQPDSLGAAHRRALFRAHVLENEMLRGGIELGIGFFGERLSFEAAPPLRLLFLEGSKTDGKKVRALLQAAQEVQLALDDDEYLVLLLGYEAQVALHEGWPRHMPQKKLGPDAAMWRLKKGERVVEILERAKQKLGGARALFTTSKAKKEHEKRVGFCLESLFAGALYQANLAHALRVPQADFLDGVAFYDEHAQASFSAFVDVQGWGSLVSLSPECFFRMNLVERWVRAYPIKGTVPRGESDEEDALRIRELQESKKDAAEHLMIVDLMRNDLGQVARKSGVSIEELMRVVPVKNVYHLESVVRGDLREDVELAEILTALSPGGSITGAPKSSAVEVIHQLEAGARGPYTGMLGVVNAKGEGAFSILIRTWLRPDVGDGNLHVGGGVVVNSTPEKEWEETLHKAAAFGDVTCSVE
ncbi:MAG: hypothetical protein GY822_22810 [Deltaproteobacteria bacterium]|nr:hypothetical protein [Deltaproteobacteria bacterium]